MNASSSSSQTDERVEWVRASMERHEAELLRYALSLVGDLAVAEDIVQDAFFKLCKQEPESLRGRLVPWLFTVVRNQALDRHRRESRWSRASEAEAAGLPGDVPTPSAAVETSDDVRNLMSPPLGTAGQSARGDPSQVPEPDELPRDFPAHPAHRDQRRFPDPHGDQDPAPPFRTSGFALGSIRVATPFPPLIPPRPRP